MASVRWRILLVAWLVYSVHFATNIVREHYPAFSLVDQFSLSVDRYQGFHPDIFVHTNGHSYIANNVAVSVLAAVPLLFFDPVLDAVEQYSNNKLSTSAPTVVTYRTPHSNSRVFYRLAKEQGLALRFGASAAITSVFLMAPLSAAIVVLMFHLLVSKHVTERRATWLAFLFALGTPIFVRTSALNHNMFVMYATFVAFFLLTRHQGSQSLVPLRDRIWAGFLCGFALAVDYSGVVPLICLFCYLILKRLAATSWRTSVRESLAFVLGSVPPVLFLLYSQWIEFGNPFFPAQFWMPAVNFTELGWRGFSWPAADIIVSSLFSLNYGMYTFGPILLVGLIPAIRYPRSGLILKRPERRFVALFMVAFLVFTAANQYSRMQFNTGFRYLLPLVPLIFLAASDHLARLRTRWLAAVSVIAISHSWVLTAVRDRAESGPDGATVLAAWRIIFQEGIQLPWLTVLKLTTPEPGPLLSSFILPSAILGGTLLAVWLLWTYGSRLQTHTSAAR